MHYINATNAQRGGVYRGPAKLATNILVVNNTRDRHTDTQAGKRTLAVRWGRKGAELEYILLYVVAYAVPVIAVTARLAAYPALLGLCTAPAALRNVRALRALDRSEQRSERAHV